MEEKLLEISEKARLKGRQYSKRDMYATLLKECNRRAFIGIAGLRGVGKTILLSQLLDKLDNAFYVSCDQIGTGLYQLAKQAENENIRYLLLDEVTYLPKWKKDLKRVYDFLQLKIVFTSSSAIDIMKSRVDLSRRVNIIAMHPFTFHEYLRLIKKMDTKKLKLPSDRIDNLSRYEAYFREYCEQGALPASADNPNLKGIVERVIESDLLRHGKLSWEEIIEVKRIFMFIANSMPEALSYTAISRNTGVTRYKTERYVKMLADSFLLKVLQPIGRNVMKEPKIYITLPFRYYFTALPKEMLEGVLREEFFVTNMAAAGKDIRYLKSTRGQKVPDFYLDGTVIEVGGKGKSRTQFKGIKYSKKIIATYPGTYDGVKVPLISFGMLE